jgi:hypothetical protein
MYRALLVLFATSLWANAADTTTIGKVYDGQLTSMEREFVPLVEAMPADQFNFAPTNGNFKGVRTFAEQAKHAAAVLYMVSAAALGEKPPVDTGGESGPDSARTKEQVVQFVQASFAYAHKAAQFITSTNELDMVKSPFGDGQVTRASLGTIMLWHSFDHYGQMVVYLRMNGIVPPASR